MKNWMLGLSIGTVLICGFFLLEKDHQIAGARSRAEAAEQQRDAVALEAAQQSKKAWQLRAQLRETQARTGEKAAGKEILRQKPAPTAGNREQKNRLLRDPKMRKAMEAEAK